MRRTIAIATTLTLTVVLTLPAALGDWSSLGGFEPDTLLDVNGPWMWPDANQEAKAKVYLNVVPSNPDLAVNPNVGLLGSRFMPAGKLGFEAFYGVWVDCNKDGYIGHAETALFEYRGELLLDDSLCPLNSPHRYADANVVAHNWVSELLWISPPGGADGNRDGVRDGRDGRSYHDVNARVWGDFGVPGDTMGGEFCPPVGAVDVTLFMEFDGAPRGTYHRTGLLLNYIDCYLNHRGFDAAQAALAPLGLGFDEQHRQDKDFDQEGHPLNVDTLGEPEHEDTMLSVWDCSGPADRVRTGQRGLSTPEDFAIGTTGYKAPVVALTDENGDLMVGVYQYDETLGDGKEAIIEENVTYRVPRLGDANPDGSVAGTYAHATRGATEGAAEEECGETDTGGNMYELIEQDGAAELANRKNRVTALFSFYEEQRSGKGKRGNPFEGGVYPVMRGPGLVLASGSRWWWSADSQEPPTLPPLFRTDRLEPQGHVMWTFYANMSSTTLGRGVFTPAGGATGLYGSEWCGSSTTGVVDGFVCDPTLWYLNPDGSAIPNSEFWPRPGTPYHLRDVDCYDGSPSKNSPVQAGGALLASDGPCPAV